MNQFFSYLINSRTLNTTHPIEEYCPLDPQKNYLFPLPHLGIIDVVGDKAADFLQGQLTADIHSVNDIHMIQAAQCNLQGRILALMDVIHWQGLKLILPQDLIAQTCHSLAKVALLSRVNLQENKQSALFGFYLQNAQDLIPEGLFLPSTMHAQAWSEQLCYYHLGQGFYVFVVAKDAIASLMAPFTAQKQIAGSLSWHTLRLINQEVSIYPQSRGLFLPHRLNLHKTSYISFDKGCYKGQEIIARTHYRATLKHQVRTISFQTSEIIYSGQKILIPDTTTEVGEVIDYSLIGAQHYIAIISILNNAPNSVMFEQHQSEVNNMLEVT